MIRRHLSMPSSPSRARRAAVGLATAAVTAAALAPVAGAPATAAPEGCDTAFPVADLTEDHALTGLTTTEGTTPTGFTARYVDVLENGIAPGVPMILAEVSSPEVERAGIWSGMSGSPVYDAATGHLVGAVAYSLSWGKSPIAGITPAEHLLALTAGGSGAATGAAAPEQVDLSPRHARAVAGTGEVSRRQAAEGMERLPLPVSIAGLGGARFKDLAGWLDDHGPVTRTSGGAAAAAAETHPIVAGGNLAASLSHGTITAAAVGTATTLCGGTVVGFGHPFTFGGKVSYSMHGAETTHIQEDSPFSGFKVADLGAPVGKVTQDRLAGIAGTLGAAPGTYPVSATARYGQDEQAGATQVTEQDMLADLGVATVLTVGDRALDAIRGGSAEATWTIRGTRRDGRPFTVERSDVYANGYDVASEPAMDLASQLYALTGNDDEEVTIDSVDITTEFGDDDKVWRLGSVEMRRGGAWQRVDGRNPVVVRAGRTRVFRVELHHRSVGSQYLRVPFRAPARAAGRVAALRLSGGGSSGGDFFFFGSDEEFFFGVDEFYGGGRRQTIPRLIRELEAEPRNDQLSVVATARRVGRFGERRLDVGRVVTGQVRVPVLVAPRRR